MDGQPAAEIGQTIDVQRIMEMIPHRYPFLMIDRLVDVVPGERATGIKNVTVNEPFFQGHFPNRPVMPGVLIVEAMAQTACAMMFSKPDYKGKLAFFMGMDEIKFRKPVVPGDVLELHVELLRSGGRAGKAKGVGMVNGQVTTEATFTFAITDKK